MLQGREITAEEALEVLDLTSTVKPPISHIGGAPAGGKRLAVEGCAVFVDRSNGDGRKVRTPVQISFLSSLLVGGKGPCEGPLVPHEKLKSKKHLDESMYVQMVKDRVGNQTRPSTPALPAWVSSTHPSWNKH